MGKLWTVPHPQTRQSSHWFVVPILGVQVKAEADAWFMSEMCASRLHRKRNTEGRALFSRTPAFGGTKREIRGQHEMNRSS
jgi:hypothetical protein